MVEIKASVDSPSGLHARPVMLLSACVQHYAGLAEIIWRGKKADLKQMTELLAMSVPYGAELTVRVSGPDETRIAQELACMIKKPGYEFPDVL